MCQQRLKEQQAAQNQGAAGAFHGNRLTSDGARGPSGSPISAHYEISRPLLTKSLLVFLLRRQVICRIAGVFSKKLGKICKQSSKSDAARGSVRFLCQLFQGGESAFGSVQGQFQLG